MVRGVGLQRCAGSRSATREARGPWPGASPARLQSIRRTAHLQDRHQLPPVLVSVRLTAHPAPPPTCAACSGMRIFSSRTGYTSPAQRSSEVKAAFCACASAASEASLDCGRGGTRRVGLGLMKCCTKRMLPTACPCPCPVPVPAPQPSPTTAAHLQEVAAAATDGLEQRGRVGSGAALAADLVLAVPARGARRCNLLSGSRPPLCQPLISPHVNVPPIKHAAASAAAKKPWQHEDIQGRDVPATLGCTGGAVSSPHAPWLRPLLAQRAWRAAHQARPPHRMVGSTWSRKCLHTLCCSKLPTLDSSSNSFLQRRARGGGTARWRWLKGTGAEGACKVGGWKAASRRSCLGGCRIACSRAWKQAVQRSATHQTYSKHADVHCSFRGTPLPRLHRRRALPGAHLALRKRASAPSQSLSFSSSTLPAIHRE